MVAQGEHRPGPAASLYVATGHSEQLSSPVESLNEPAGQRVQVRRVASSTSNPATHEQFCRLTLARGLLELPGHSKHCSLANVGLYCPGAHATHTPVGLRAKPARHQQADGPMLLGSELV